MHNILPESLEVLLLLDCCLLALLGTAQTIAQRLNDFFLGGHLAGSVDHDYLLDTLTEVKSLWSSTAYRFGMVVGYMQYIQLHRVPAGIAGAGVQVYSKVRTFCTLQHEGACC